MKAIKILYLLLFTVYSVIFIGGCKKDKAETVIKDIDGNIYNPVQIGTQVWMEENLKTTKFVNGDVIPTTVPAFLSMADEESPVFQWAYGGIESNVAAYGRLYTGFVVTDSRKLCPKGWHVPADAEWSVLTDYLTSNGFGYQGEGDDIGKSMAASSGWTSDPTAGNIGNDQAGNDSSGFRALPGGIRNISAPPMGTSPFSLFNKSTRWWTSPESNADSAWVRGLSYNSGIVERKKYNMKNGFSVRCLRD